MSDLIDRQAAIDAMAELQGRASSKGELTGISKAWKRIKKLPPIQPETPCYLGSPCEYQNPDVVISQPEPHYDEWCTDCKEYDQERHCCPRWNRVIRETLKDAQPEIVRCRDCKYGEQDEIGRWYCRGLGCQMGDDDGNGFCSDAEKREE